MIDIDGGLIELVPFATEVMGIVAWATTEDGSIIGPVGPSGMIMKESKKSAFELVLRFHFKIHSYARISGAFVQLSGTTRPHQVPRDYVDDGDTYVLTYTLNCHFD